jgi:hypothetical protein
MISGESWDKEKTYDAAVAAELMSKHKDWKSHDDKQSILNRFLNSFNK